MSDAQFGVSRIFLTVFIVSVVVFTAWSVHEYGEALMDNLFGGYVSTCHTYLVDVGNVVNGRSCLLRIISLSMLGLTDACMFHTRSPKHVHVQHTDEVDSGKSYCDQSNIEAYIPQIRHNSFEYPLMACIGIDMDINHIGWRDPVRDHEFYNLKSAVDYLRDEQTHFPVLSIVKQYTRDLEDLSRQVIMEQDEDKEESEEESDEEEKKERDDQLAPLDGRLASPDRSMRLFQSLSTRSGLGSGSDDDLLDRSEKSEGDFRDSFLAFMDADEIKLK